MIVYFIRHGQTNENAEGLEQNSDSQLSEIGKEQCQQLAKKFQNLQVGTVYASPAKRTMQTAEAIANALNKKIIYSKLIEEKKKPEDENFDQFKKRAGEFYSFLNAEAEESIIVVSHAGHIKLTIFLMIFGNDFLDAYHGFAHHIEISNASVTVCRKNASAEWTVEIINDCSHLT